MEENAINELEIYQNACKRVKEIAETIKSIRTKYYPNLARISAEDKQRQEELQKEMDELGEKNNLAELVEPLKEDINNFNSFDNIVPQNYRELLGNQDERNKLYKKIEEAAKYAVTVEFYALRIFHQNVESNGKSATNALKRSKQCKAELDRYLAVLKEHTDGAGNIENIILFRQKKAEELGTPLNKVKENDRQWSKYFSSHFREKDAQERENFSKEIKQTMSQEKEPIKDEEPLLSVGG